MGLTKVESPVLGLGAYRRNILINGDFKIWQRGAAVTPAVGAKFVADRWGFLSLGAAPTTNSRGSGYGGALYALYIGGAAANTAMNIYQRVEDIDMVHIAGNPVNLSAWVYTSDSRAVTLQLSHPTAGPNNYDTLEVVLTVTLAAASGWRRVSLQGTWPSSKVNGVEVGLLFGATLAGVSLALTCVQLELGRFTTDFDFQPVADELARCQRYYEIGTAIWSGMVTSGADYYLTVPFKNTKLKIPTTTPTYIFNKGFPPTAPLASATQAVDSLAVYKTADSTIVDGFMQFNWEASAEL